MNIALQLDTPATTPPSVEYRWDRDTDILTARVAEPADGTGLSGSVELEGADGSWLVLDVARGRISGVEVAVWPDVHKSPRLEPPKGFEDARVLVPLRAVATGPATLELNVPLLAEADDAERVIHFRVGAKRQVRTIRLAQDVLVDLDPQDRLAGVWLLNVPPFPTS